MSAPRETEIDGESDLRPLNDTFATTGPGLPDEALAVGETLEDELVPEGGEGERVRWPALGRGRMPSA